MNEIYHRSEQTLFGRLVDDYLVNNGDFYTEKVVHDFEDRYIVEVQVPGFMSNELELAIENHTILLTGYNVSVKQRFIFKNIEKTPVFQRSLVMPVDAASNTVTARYQPGLIQIVCLKQMVPRSHQRNYLLQRRRVKINDEKHEKVGFKKRVQDFVTRVLTFESISS